MPQRQRVEIAEEDITGLKHFSKVRKLLKRLHSVGCERDRAGNRELHFDDYCLLILLHLFNPIVTSLKGLQQASELRNVQKKLGVRRASIGSLSESVRVFDPTLLKEIAAELQQRVPNKRPGEFASIKHTITAVDGSVFDTVARVAELAWLPKANGKTKYAYRLHTQFEVLRGTPARIDVTAANPKGEADERAVLGRTIESDRCYLIDRGYAKFELWNAINRRGSSYVCRARDNSVYETIQLRELTQADLDEGVLGDRVVRMGSGNREIDHAIRFITVTATPHTSRGRHKRSSTGPDCDGQIRLVTNLMDVPAELISKLYRLRWMIELFFRMFKGLLGVRHLLSSREEGVEIHAYMAIIACLLILIHTGRTPTKRTFEMICFYLSGWAELDELEAHIAKLKVAESKAA